MSGQRRPNRRISPCRAVGTSGSHPARRASAVRIPSGQHLLQASDQLMWWGWVVAVAFVAAGLLWHLLTYQQGKDLRMARPSGLDEQVVECRALER